MRHATENTNPIITVLLEKCFSVVFEEGIIVFTILPEDKALVQPHGAVDLVIEIQTKALQGD